MLLIDLPVSDSYVHYYLQTLIYCQNVTICLNQTRTVIHDHKFFVDVKKLKNMYKLILDLFIYFRVYF